VKPKILKGLCHHVIQKPLVYALTPDIKIFFSLLNFALVFEVLMPRLKKIIQIIIFILNSLRGCSMQIQICSMRIQNTPGAASA
jgi:hypothetical protein